jgi:hypothetical protein
MVGIPKVGKTSFGTRRAATHAASINAITATITVTGRRKAVRAIEKEGVDLFMSFWNQSAIATNATQSARLHL